MGFQPTSPPHLTYKTNTNLHRVPVVRIFHLVLELDGLGCPQSLVIVDGNEAGSNQWKEWRIWTTETGYKTYVEAQGVVPDWLSADFTLWWDKYRNTLMMNANLFPIA